MTRHYRVPGSQLEEILRLQGEVSRRLTGYRGASIDPTRVIEAYKKLLAPEVTELQYHQHQALIEDFQNRLFALIGSRNATEILGLTRDELAQRIIVQDKAGPSTASPGFVGSRVEKAKEIARRIEDIEASEDLEPPFTKAAGTNSGPPRRLLENLTRPR